MSKAKKPPVKCPGCGKRFYREDEPFIHLKNRYWHTKCYNSHIEAEEKAEKDLEQLEKYICELFNTSYVSPRIRKQINSYVSNYNFTHSGILGSLKYWFEIKNGSIEKANGGIGIVPYIYKDASEYFESLYHAHEANKNVQTLESEVRTIKIQSPKRKIKRLKEIDLDFLEEEKIEDEQ